MVFEEAYSTALFRDDQLAYSVNKILDFIDREDIKLIVIHNLAKFFETSKKPVLSSANMSGFILPIRQVAIDKEAALIITCKYSGWKTYFIPKPKGGYFLRHLSNVIVYLKPTRERFYARAYLIKHPYIITPKSTVVNMNLGDLYGKSYTLI